ncbi:MAG: nucleoside recognition protein [Lachnospiraceae bacterium]|nr:nucleoside recognition protein [Lachnospiraceae bacterium]
MDLLWAGMLLCGMIYAAFSGNLEAVTEIILSSAKEAVQLGIGMAGVLAFWTGLMEIAQDCGLVNRLTRSIRPVIRFLFPDIPDGHRAQEYISLNMIANMLGLGGAATPAGLEAMKALEQIEEERRNGRRAGRKRPKGTASNEMCTFLILNISSLQLIPVNMIAWRSQYGSSNPEAIVGPALLATACSTLTAVIYCKWKMRKAS